MSVDEKLIKLIALGYDEFTFLNVGNKSNPLDKWGFQAKGKRRPLLLGKGDSMSEAVSMVLCEAKQIGCGKLKVVEKSKEESEGFFHIPW